MAYCLWCQACWVWAKLIGSEPTWRSGWSAMPEGLRAALTGTGHPLTHGPLADAQCLGDLALRPAFLLGVHTRFVQKFSLTSYRHN
jgi:hypothetical protein